MERSPTCNVVLPSICDVPLPRLSIFPAKSAKRLFYFGVLSHILGAILLLCAIMSPDGDPLLLLSFMMQFMGMYLVVIFKNFKQQAVQEKEQQSLYLTKVEQSEKTFFLDIQKVVPLNCITLTEHSLTVTLPSQSGMNISRIYNFKRFNPLSE